MLKVILDFDNKMQKSYNKFEEIYTLIFTKTLSVLKINAGTFITEVLIVSDGEIKELNARTRGIDEVTDVLSFAYNEPEVLKNYQSNAQSVINLGSIVINADRAEEQARRFEHTIKRELSFLFVHGLLHLFGFDHETLDEEQMMFDLQNEIIGKRGKENG